MIKCPFCAEDIQDEAVKCRYCGEFLDGRGQRKWYFNTYWLVIGLLCVGPFALPLLWFNPRFSRTTKIVVSIAVIIVSYLLYVWFQKSMATLEDYYKLIQ